MSDAPVAPGAATVTGIQAGATLAPGQRLAARYRIEALLGIGGMGVVYRATDEALDVPVAIKLLRPELAQRPEAFERFRQELLLARQVSSPHVVRIHDIARDGERWFISMDLIDGEALDRRLDREGTLPVDEALSIARQLAEGLGAAHARGVVHRDLKPSNVLIDRDGRACIADFGVARSLGTSGLTHSGAVVGTPDYLSPEQARGTAVDARSDLYALGLLLYEMLAGRLPFDGATPAESISQRIAGTPTPLRQVRADVPAWVEALVSRMLRTAPAHRFQNAREVIDAIDSRRAPADWLAWRRRALQAGVLALLIAAAGVLYWSWPRGTLVPELPPARRVLVVAEPSADEAVQARSEAVADLLRLALQSNAGTAAVDAERTRQALATLAIAEGVTVTDEALQKEVPGADIARVAADGDGVRASWHPVDGDARDLELPRGLPEAMPRLLREVAPPATWPALLPASDAALRAYGEGVRLRAQGRFEPAQRKFADALALDSAFDAAALAQAESAWFAGNAAVAQRASDRRAIAALQPRFDALQAWFGGDAELAAGLAATRLTGTPDDLATVLQQANVHGEGGDLAAAIDALRELVKRDPGEARAWFLLGKYSILRGEVKAAVDEYLVRALLLFKRGRNAWGEAETINALGVGYARLGQMQDAQEQYSKAVVLRRELGNRRGVASTLRNLAQIALIRGDHDTAAKQLAEARALFEALDDRTGLAAIDNELGLLAEERGDYAGALEAYRRALRGREAIGDALGSAESLNNIGFSHYQLGDYDSAQVFWRQAGEAFAAQDDLNGSTRTQQNLGLLEIARGHWNDARTLLEASLQTAERQQLVEEAAVTRRNLAELELWQGHFIAAFEQLARAQALFKERDDRRGLADAALLRAQIHVMAMDGAGALGALDEASDVLGEAAAEQRTIAALLRTQALELQGDEPEAAAALAQADTLAQAAGVRALQLQARVLRDEPEGELDEALATLGHRPLWLMRQLRRLAQDENAKRYREAIEALESSGDYAHAWRLHRLGAGALRAAGDETAAAQAEAAAQQEVQRVLAAATPELREALARATGTDAAQ